MSLDPLIRDRLLALEIGLDRQVSEEVVPHDWGHAFLCPSSPLVWDSSWLAVEEPGMGAEEALALSDRVLGEAGMAHGTIVPCGEEDGRRMAEEAVRLANWEAQGWKIERVLYMTWRGDRGREPAVSVRETRLVEIEPLRRALIRESLPEEVTEVEATVEQLLEIERRFGAAAGDRWFVASDGGEAASACRLFTGEGIGQVEDVATLKPARGQGLAQAIVLTALAESLANGAELTFLSADADDWPRLMYEKLGFATVGELLVLRRPPIG